MEVCRIQTSSAGKEKSDIEMKIKNFFFNTLLPSFLESRPVTYLLGHFWLKVVLEKTGSWPLLEISRFSPFALK